MKDGGGKVVKKRILARYELLSELPVTLYRSSMSLY